MIFKYNFQFLILSLWISPTVYHAQTYALNLESHILTALLYIDLFIEFDDQ